LRQNRDRTVHSRDGIRRKWLIIKHGNVGKGTTRPETFSTCSRPSIDVIALMKVHGVRPKLRNHAIVEAIVRFMGFVWPRQLRSTARIALWTMFAFAVASSAMGQTAGSLDTPSSSVFETGANAAAGESPELPGPRRTVSIAVAAGVAKVF
jgi:hypothetical protein